MTQQDLIARGKAALTRSLADLIEQPQRRARLQFDVGGLYLDFARAQVSLEELDALLAMAEAQGLTAARTALFAGEAINITEDRAVLHMALRQPDRAFSAKGEDIQAD